MAKRLSPLDAVFLQIETPDMLGHVAGLQIFALPAHAPADFLHRLVAQWRGPRELAGPWNLKLKPSRMQRWVPAWVVDHDVDLDYHVRHVALPQPGGERELGVLISRLHSHRLNRRRPLWECYVIEGLERGRFAVYTKIHHSIADGVTALRLLTQSLGETVDAATPAPWAVQGTRRATPLAPPRQDAARPAQRVLPALAKAFGRLAKSAFGERELAVPFTAPHSALNVKITGQRRFATQQLDIARLREVGKAMDATLNDVVLALCAAGLRRFLQEANALPRQPLMAAVPVSVRPAGDTTSANAVSMMFAGLATDIADPKVRLEVISGGTARAKRLVQDLPRAAIAPYTNLVLAPFVLQVLAGLTGKVRPYFNLAISNVPGPARALYLNGARLEAMYPVSNPFDGQALNITVTSYAGVLNFGFTGCREALPHLQRLAVYTGEALAELEEAVGIGGAAVPAPIADAA